MTSSGRTTRPSRATNRCTRSMNGHLAPFRRRPEPFQLTSANPRHASSGWGETPLGCSRPFTSCRPGEMRNERLRALLLERGKTPDQLAEAVRVDAKTVERWITRGRLPYRRHRFEVASFLGVDESYIWPDALGKDEIAVVSESEVVAVYPHRSEVPRDFWGHLFSHAEREIGVLVYAGLFLSEDAGIQKIFKDKASSGVRVRILLGDPDSQVVNDRG